MYERYKKGDNMRLAIVNKGLEDFLNKEEEHFCRYRCPYSNGEPVESEVEDFVVTCNNCWGHNTVHERRLGVNPCEHCVVIEFIREIRDADFELK